MGPSVKGDISPRTKTKIIKNQRSEESQSCINLTKNRNWQKNK